MSIIRHRYHQRFGERRINYAAANNRIGKTYTQGGVSYQALKGVDLEFEAEKFYAIIGKSGSGKSTLLHLLGSLDRPTGGQVILNGEDIYKLKDTRLAQLRRRQIGFIFQSYNLLDEHTAKDNILAPVLLDGKKPDMAYFDQITQELGIAELLRKYPWQMSGGEQQRCAIARALLTRPSIILADEPTGNLDSATSEQVVQLLRRVVDDFHQTLILVTHDPDIAAQADICITIDSGLVKSIRTQR